MTSVLSDTSPIFGPAFPAISFSIGTSHPGTQAARSPELKALLDSRMNIVAGHMLQCSWATSLSFEAVPLSGVRPRSAYERVTTSIMRVRRHPHLGMEDRFRLAIAALRMLGLRYSWWKALQIGSRLLGGLWRPSGPLVGRVVICSKVFYDASAEATRVLLADCPRDGMTTPAHLSATASLEDVEVDWLRILPE
jgi:hypothetical protein